MVPEGWKSIRLGQISSTITSGSRDWARYYSDSGSKFLRMTNLSRGEIRLKLGDMKYVSVDTNSADGKRTSLVAGDILMSITAELGKIGIIPDKFGEAFINQHTALIRTKESHDSRYVAFQLSSHRMNSIINRLNDSGAKAGLNLPTVRAIPLLSAPLPEQKKIAKILSTWDEAIVTTEQLLANSQQQKKALMQQLLTGKKRFPGFEGEWNIRKLGDLFSRVTTKNSEENTNVVTISAQHGLIRQEEFFKKSVASSTLTNYFLLSKGQFAYNKSYSNGYPMGAIKRLNRYNKGVVTTLYICFEVSNFSLCCPNYFEQYFNSGLLNKGLSQIAHEGGRAHGLLNVKPADFFKLKIPTPSIEEQQAIAAALTTADAEIDTLQQKLDRLKQEKKALMQQLLTGKRRVKVKMEVVK